jgi:hypothetical protein
MWKYMDCRAILPGPVNRFQTGAFDRHVGGASRFCGMFPNLWMEISSFKPKLQHWTELEKLDFWNDDDGDYLQVSPACSRMFI